MNTKGAAPNLRTRTLPVFPDSQDVPPQGICQFLTRDNLTTVLILSLTNRTLIPVFYSKWRKNWRPKKKKKLQMISVLCLTKRMTSPTSFPVLLFCPLLNSLVMFHCLPLSAWNVSFKRSGNMPFLKIYHQYLQQTGNCSNSGIRWLGF